MNVDAAFPLIPHQALESIALAMPNDSVTPVSGLSIEAVPSHRGETRVWRVKAVNSSANWYVKRFRHSADYQRYLQGLHILEQDESGSYLCPIRCAGQDDTHRLIATYPLQGTSLKALFVRGTRFDKLPWWLGSDLPTLARRIGRGLRSFWRHRCEPHSDLYDYRPLATADRMLKKCMRLRELMPESWERLQSIVTHHAQHLRSINKFDESFVLGDLALDNLLLCNNERLGVFDLDDIGIGDWRRDIACLMQRISEAEAHVYYSRSRVRRFQRLLLDEFGLAANDLILAIYRIESYLDMLWSARPCHDDRGLPTVGFSSQVVEQMLDRHLQSLDRKDAVL